MPLVIISGPAERDIEVAYAWWKKNRSEEQANRWYTSILAEIRSLSSMPERCSMAEERDLLSAGVRQLLFGLGRRATHRVVFAIDGDDVIVLRVRHSSQDALSLDDLDT
ncbi:MAG: type II toxin-antitoxin system RelE/ParE family toxin [Pirellulales bacterium]